LNQLKKKEYFTDLYHQNFGYVYSYIFARTGGNSQLTEDIVQETFSTAWSSFDRFGNKSTFRTWLCSIAKNKLRESYRKAIYRKNLEILDDENFTEYASSFDLENMVLDNETRLHVLEAMNKITPLYKYALIMKYIDGMSVKEMAKVLGKSSKAVDGVLQRAKAAFEKAFLKEGTKENYEG
jgi:RNA polymerase sigma-70 factor, ECF subfamily